MTFPAPRLVDRYIFKHLTDYFLLGLTVFTLVAFFSDTLLKFIQDVQKYGISFGTLLTLVGLQLPKSVALVMPASAFLAALMVYNQLNNHFEIIAMRMNGISLWRLMLPAVALGLFCSVSAYALSDYVVPWCNAQTARLKELALSETSLPSHGNSFTYNTFDENHNLVQMIYVNRYQGRVLGDTTILDLSNPKVMQVYQARSGTLDSFQGWQLENVNHYTLVKAQDNTPENQKFSSGHLGSLQLNDLIKNAKLDEKRQEMTQGKQEGTWISAEQQSFAQMFAAIQKRESKRDKVARGNYLQLWAKLTWPLSCLVIILSAVPLSLTPPRQGSNRGFVYAVGVLFLFYMLHNSFQNIGKASQLDFMPGVPLPIYLMILAWLPIVLMTGIGISLIRQKNRIL